MSSVMLAIPIRGEHAQPSWKTQQCIELAKVASKHGLDVRLSRGQQITQNSYRICDDFLRGRYDYLCYTGDDIVFPPYAIDRLISVDADIASAVCTWKSPPYWVPAVKMADGQPKYFLITRPMVENNVLLELDMVGSGFIVVKRRVVEAIMDFLRDKVYPQIPDEFKWLSAVPYFPVTYDPRWNAILSSDFSFCRLAKQAMKATVVMDCGIVCRHRHEGEYDITDHWDWVARHGFSRDEERFFGDTPPHRSAREENIYWGELGNPLDIVITSAGNEYHAINHILPTLRGEWQDIKDATNPKKFKSGYVVGFHVSPGHVEFEDYIRWSDQFDRVLIHWVGTDIVRIKDWITPERKELLSRPKFVHLVEDERTRPEVAEHFPDVRVLPIPTANEFSLLPLPERFSVAVYYPKHRHDFHYGDVLKGVIEAMPDVEFRLYHLFGEAPDFKYDNMAWLGHLEGRRYPDMLARTSCMLRLSQHDGRPFSIVEAAIMGRRFITNFDMPFTHRVPDVPTVEDVVKVLREIQNEREPDLSSAEYYRMANSRKSYRDSVAILAALEEGELPGRKKYDYHEYWSGRYSTGPRGGGGPSPMSKEAEWVNTQIIKALSDAGCKTVLDAGCGSMVRWQKLPVADEDYKGCDVSPEAVRYAADRFPKAQFFVADLAADPIPPADAVLAIDVLPHIKPDDFKKVVGKLFHAAERLVVLKIAMGVDDNYYQHNVALPHEWGVLKEGEWFGRGYNIPDNKVAKLWVFTRSEVEAPA